MTKNVVTEFIIENGLIQDETYDYEVHSFFEDKVLRILLVLPGIIGESIQVNVEDTSLQLRAHIDAKYNRIFKGSILKLTKQLPEPVRKNVLVADYDKGILELKLIREFSSEDSNDH